MSFQPIKYVFKQFNNILNNQFKKNLLIKRFKTIYALSSGALPSAIAIVRISGIKIYMKVFKKKIIFN